MRHINGITKVISLTISEFHQKLSCQIVLDTHILEQNICIETKVSRSETIAEWPCSWALPRQLFHKESGRTQMTEVRSTESTNYVFILTESADLFEG